MNKTLHSLRSGSLVCSLALAAGLVLAGCGGPPRGTPTPIPASVVRPVQPTPSYPGGANVFTLQTPVGTPQFVPTTSSVTAETSSAADAQRAAIKLFIENQMPSAVGIATGGTTIYAERGGKATASVPVGGVLTVTGKSADGKWIAVYDESANYGWAPTGQVRVYGGDDLIVVDKPLNPGPIATLLAQANQPVNVLDKLLEQAQAANTADSTRIAGLAATPAALLAPTLSRAAPLTSTLATTPVPPATPTPVATATPTATVTPTALPPPPLPTITPTPGPITGTVAGDARVNLRTTPATAGAIIRKLDPGSTLTILGRTADNQWLRAQWEDGSTGWVATEFIRPIQPLDALPVIEIR